MLLVYCRNRKNIHLNFVLESSPIESIPNILFSSHLYFFPSKLMFPQSCVSAYQENHWSCVSYLAPLFFFFSGSPTLPFLKLHFTMPAASFVATPIERSLAFVKNSSGSNNIHGYPRNKFQNLDHTANAVLTTKLDFIKYEKPSVKHDIKTKYHTLSADITNNINSICSTYSKSKLSLNNVSSPLMNERKSLSSKESTSNGSGSKCLLPKPKEVLYSPSKITLGWQGRVPVGAGMVNAINTCYLNSCLQVRYPCIFFFKFRNISHIIKVVCVKIYFSGETLIFLKWFHIMIMGE